MEQFFFVSSEEFGLTKDPHEDEFGFKNTPTSVLGLKPCLREIVTPDTLAKRQLWI